MRRRRERETERDRDRDRIRWSITCWLFVLAALCEPGGQVALREYGGGGAGGFMLRGSQSYDAALLQTFEYIHV